VIDLRPLRDEPDRVRQSQRARGEDPGLVDALLAADVARRGAVRRFDDLRAEQRRIGRDVATAQGPLKGPLLVQAKELAAEVREVEATLADADAALRAAHLAIPNVIEDGVRPGGEDDYVVLEEAAVPTYDFEVRDHLALGELLGAIDVQRGAKVSGARFYYLTGIGALLEFALVNLAVAQAVAAGFTPVIAPALVKAAAMEGTGFLGAHAAEVYRLAEDELYLVGTSEVPLAAYHAEEILDGGTLPLRYAGFSSCFRREAGSYGKDTRGIIRVHQFDKVDLLSSGRGDRRASTAARVGTGLPGRA
jgi:Seryl-tRNA synthetase